MATGVGRAIGRETVRVVGARGWLDVPTALTEPERIFVLTCLCVNGPGPAMEMARTVERKEGRAAEALAVLAAWGLARACGARSNGEAVFGATGKGRLALWRLGQAARATLPVADEIPLAGDMPEDPVLAVRRYVRAEWADPVGLAMASHFLEGGPMRVRMLANRLVVGRPRVRAMLGEWERAGLATRDAESAFSRRELARGEWDMSVGGHLALVQHVEALEFASR